MLDDKRLITLLLVSLMIIGLIIFSNYLSFRGVQDAMYNQLLSTHDSETRHLAEQMENHIIEVKNELVTLSKFPNIDALSTNNCVQDENTFYHSFDGKIEDVLRADKDGDIIECSSPAYSDFFNLNIRHKDYFLVPQETLEPYITTNLQYSKSQIIISTPLFKTKKYTPYPNFLGEFDGVLITIIELNRLYEIYLFSYVSQEDRSFLIFDAQDNTTLLKSPFLNESLVLDSIDESNTIITDIDGVGRSIISSADLFLGDKKLRLVIITPLINATRNLSSLQTRHVISMLLILIVSALSIASFASLLRSKKDIEHKLKKANVTLEKYGIKIGIEENRYADSDIKLDMHKVYLVKENDQSHYELFIDCLNKGFAGLGILRTNPVSFKEKYGLNNTSFVWLSKSKIKEVPSETDIHILFDLISKFIKKSKSSAVLIERLDYLISENGFNEVIKVVRSLTDIANTHNTIILLSVNPDVIQDKELKQIEAETADVYADVSDSNIQLDDMQFRILSFINQNNINNKLVSYKDITNTFNITKPTTRAKIKQLRDAGLIRVEQKGRYKALMITSAGRRLL